MMRSFCRNGVHAVKNNSMKTAMVFSDRSPLRNVPQPTKFVCTKPGRVFTAVRPAGEAPLYLAGPNEAPVPQPKAL